ncbi:MAG: hypothetical protein R6X23_03045 [Acidimicrobiia bacterium]
MAAQLSLPIEVAERARTTSAWTSTMSKHPRRNFAAAPCSRSADSLDRYPARHHDVVERIVKFLDAGPG